MKNKIKIFFPHFTSWLALFLMVCSVMFCTAVVYADETETPSGGETGTPSGSETETSPEDETQLPISVTPSGLTVSFLNVDHGSCTILQCDGEIMVVDGGPLVKYNQATESWTNIPIGNRALDYLTRCGIGKVDYVVASHPHADHINGLVPILDTLPVDHILMPPVTYETVPTASYRKFLDAVALNGAPVTYPSMGSIVSLGGATITTIAPNSDWYEDANNYSMVLRVEYGNRSFLVCGDCLKESEAEMMELGYELGVDVMAVPHHGIAGVNTYATDHYEFIRAVKPFYAVVSKNMVASYPLLAVLRETADVYYTHSSGTVVFYTDGETFDISMEHGNEPDFYASANLSVDSKDPELGLRSIEEDNPIDRFYKKKLTLEFSGNYGIHQYTNIETLLVEEGEEFSEDAEWTEGNVAVAKADFAGRAYVRYTNEKGEYVYAVTNGFAVDRTGIEEVIIQTASSDKVKAVKKTKVNKKPITFEKRPVVSASAITGPSGIKEISYQLVKTGKNLKETKWVVGDEVKLKREFSGNVYFKIVDNCGRTKIRKTQWLTVLPKKKK